MCLVASYSRSNIHKIYLGVPPLNDRSIISAKKGKWHLHFVAHVDRTILTEEGHRNMHARLTCGPQSVEHGLTSYQFWR